jgi:C1A family cysteine protease
MPIGFKGHRRAPNKDHLIALSARRRRAPLAHASEPQWDSRTFGWIPPIKDQGQCGSCWDFSGTFVCEVAYWKAGLTTVILSEEYTLSCGSNGGCNGDDNVNVLDWAKKTGLPLSADYGPYSAQAGQCAFKPSMTLYKIDDWGFVDGSSGQGVTPTQQIKDAIKAYGCVGCAVAAGGDSFWDSGTGIGSGTNHSIDHDVGIIGWDDSKGGGAWLMRNSWGTKWGDGGYAWVKYGAYDLGTEAVWAKINASAPPIDWVA